METTSILMQHSAPLFCGGRCRHNINTRAVALDRSHARSDRTMGAEHSRPSRAHAEPPARANFPPQPLLSKYISEQARCRMLLHYGHVARMRAPVPSHGPQPVCVSAAPSGRRQKRSARRNRYVTCFIIEFHNHHDLDMPEFDSSKTRCRHHRAALFILKVGSC